MKTLIERLEVVGNRLSEALILTHGLMNARAQASELTEQEAQARVIYSHIHWAMKDMAKILAREMENRE